MPDLTTCTVCQRPDRADVDAGLDAGDAISAVARRFGIIRTTLQRHIKHRDAKPAKAPEVDAVHPDAALPSISRAPEPAPALRAAPLPSSPPLPEPTPAAEQSPGKGIALPSGRTRPGPGRRCACCSSEHRPEIDRLLCQGASYKAIEARLAPDGPSDDSIEHHTRRCIPHLLGARAEELRAEVLTTVRARAERLMTKAERLVEEAEGSVLCANCQGPTEPASPRDRAATINAANSVIVTLGKLLGELGADVDVRVVLDSPRFAAEREAIQRALRRHPAARADVIAELEALAAQQGELGGRR